MDDAEVELSGISTDAVKLPGHCSISTTPVPLFWTQRKCSVGEPLRTGEPEIERLRSLNFLVGKIRLLHGDVLLGT